MTNIRNIIARGQTLTGRQLRDAIESAAGAITGGRGISVSTIEGQSVVSLKGHPIIGGGGAGVTLGLVEFGDADFNATYQVGPLQNDIQQLPADQQLFGVVPQGRMFDIDAVDFHKADVGTLALIHPLPLASGYEGPWYDSPGGGEGGCLQISGDCAPSTEGGCTGTFLGVGSPCASVYITEHVKISTCPAPAASGPLPPPPVVTQVTGLLT